MNPQRASIAPAVTTLARAGHPYLRAVDGATHEHDAATTESELRAITGPLRSVKRGCVLYRSGDALSSLFLVHSGSFKTCLSLEDGRSQVMGFQLSGEWLGLDGIGGGRHPSDAVALEDSQVRGVDFDEFEARLASSAEVLLQFRRLMSREIVRGQDMMLLLGGMCAEARVARFLLDLAKRLHERGGPATSMLLSMTRDDIGSFLGLKLETVSRMLSRLRDLGALKVTQRHVELVDMSALQFIAHRDAV